MDQSETSPDDSNDKLEHCSEPERIFRALIERRKSREDVSIDAYIRWLINREEIVFQDPINPASDGNSL